MKQFILTEILIIIFQVFLFAQAPDTLWTKTFGGLNSEVGYSVQQTSDGGYIITGSTVSFSAGSHDLWLLKTDSNGDSLWAKSFGGVSSEIGRSLQQTSDGGYIITGYTVSFGAGSRDAWLIKTDLNGDSMWTKTLGELGVDDGNSVQQTSDGGYIITGFTTSFGVDGQAVLLLKTDSNGVTQWTKTFGGSNIGDSDEGNSVKQTSDGGYIVTGFTTSFGSGNVLLFKTDANGNSLWVKTFGGTALDEGNSVQQTSDGGYIITGYTASFGTGVDLWLIKTDSNGDSLWAKTFGGSALDEGYSVQQTSDGGYMIAGNWSGFDLWLIKTDVNGDTLWTKTFDRSSNERCYSAQQTSDGGYILTGYTSFGGPNTQIWLIKVASDVTAIDDDVTTIASDYVLQQNFLNPFNPSTTIKFSIPSESFTTLKVYDILGNEIAELVNEQLAAGNYRFNFVADNLPSGVYFYTIHAGEFTETKKMMLLR